MTHTCRQITCLKTSKATFGKAYPTTFLLILSRVMKFCDFEHKPMKEAMLTDETLFNGGAINHALATRDAASSPCHL